MGPTESEGRGTAVEEDTVNRESAWLNITIRQRPRDPVDMGVAIDPGGRGAVLWTLGADGVVHIENLMNRADHA